MTSNSPKYRKSGIPVFSIFASDIRDEESDIKMVIPNVHEFTSVKDIRSLIASRLNCPVQSIQLFHRNNPARSVDLKDSQSLHDLKISHGMSDVIEYSVSHFSMTPESLPSILSTSQSKTVSVSPASVGTSGVYFVESLRDHTREVFKPSDEEQGMINNPKGYKSKPLKEFFEPGQGMFREYAAYLLDVNNFCKIPRTRLVRLEDETFQYGGNTLFPKMGALQEFVPNGEEICEYGSELFSDFQIQKIALLDLRLLNCDRNDGNVLVTKKALSPSDLPANRCDMYELIPIDHGYCLPAQLRIDCWDWFWFSYPQVSRPICPEIVEYFKSINIDEQVAIMSKEVTVSSNCIFLIKLVHDVILKSIEKGLTLNDIARIIARVEETCPSPLEKMISEAESNSYATLDARTSRYNSHALSTSFETVKSLFGAPEPAFRNRSYSVTDSSPPTTWNSPTRRAIISSTQKFISGITESEFHPVPQFPSSILESDADTDDSSFSTDMSECLSVPSTVSSTHSRSKPRYGEMQGKPMSYTKSLDLSTSSSARSPMKQSKDFGIPMGARNQANHGKIEAWNVSLNRENLSKHVSAIHVYKNQERPDESTPIFVHTDYSDDSTSYDRSSGTSNMFRMDEFGSDDEQASNITPFGCGADSASSGQPAVLRRMVSFAAVPSPQMYEYNSAYEEKLTETLSKAAVEPFDVVKGRCVPKKVLQQQVSSESLEFQNLRKNFAQNMVKFLVRK